MATLGFGTIVIRWSLGSSLWGRLTASRTFLRFRFLPGLAVTGKSVLPRRINYLAWAWCWARWRLSHQSHSIRGVWRAALRMTISRRPRTAANAMGVDTRPLPSCRCSC